MKYIRTKDEIYEELDYISNARVKIEREYCLKTADTIEELCDKFVMLRLKDEMNDNEPLFFKHLDLAKSYFEKYLGYAIYGAIWTDKGLIFVARMNNDGVLELL